MRPHDKRKCAHMRQGPIPCMCNVIDRLSVDPTTPFLSPSLSGPLSSASHTGRASDGRADRRSSRPLCSSLLHCPFSKGPRADDSPRTTITSLRPYQGGKSPQRTNSAVLDSWPRGQLVAAIFFLYSNFGPVRW